MILINDISKKFKLYRSPADRLKEIVSRRCYHKEFQALANISFAVGKGETLGIIGPNGAGKSTLLKVLTGVLIPDSGQVEINGRITGLLELGTGFNAEFSGLDNIYLNAIYLGLSKDEIDDRLDRIISFTELHDFIHEPLKTYSSGMVMRLAFSVAINADPQAFVVDEALSVGDAYFQQKCMRKIKEFKENGGSIVFVSHDMNAVKVLCDKAILLNSGEIFKEGNPETIINCYNRLVSTFSDDERLISNDENNENSHGTFEGKITNVAIYGINSQSNIIASGEEVEIIVDIDSAIDLDNLSSGIMIRDRFGQDIFGTNTFLSGIEVSISEGRRYQIRYTMELNIGPGKYTISSALEKNPLDKPRRLHWIDKIANFEVVTNNNCNYTGLCKLNPVVSFAEL